MINHPHHQHKWVLWINMVGLVYWVSHNVSFCALPRAPWHFRHIHQPWWFRFCQFQQGRRASVFTHMKCCVQHDKLQVLCALLGRVSGCMLATYKSYALCWTGFGVVCWQPAGLMRSLWTGSGAVCWQPTGLMRSVGPKWGWMLATYKSCGLCWTGFGAVCSQPTGLMGSVGQGFRLYVGNLQVLCALLDRNGAECWQPTGLMRSLWTGFGAVCWPSTGLMRSVGPGLGLYVDNLQVLCASFGPGLDRVWGCMLATYRSYALPFDRVWGCMLATYRSYAAIRNIDDQVKVNTRHISSQETWKNLHLPSPGCECPTMFHV